MSRVLDVSANLPPAALPARSHELVSDGRFVWLSLHGMVHNSGDLVTVLFHPDAQGTVRTFSERSLLRQIAGHIHSNDPLVTFEK